MLGLHQATQGNVTSWRLGNPRASCFLVSGASSSTAPACKLPEAAFNRVEDRPFYQTSVLGSLVVSQILRAPI
ncbi:hypothetical protein PENSPDRAFT_255521 [Peniophora sp. CONT]|nr:hypothetical protein PENSPDRAFT_255521 [Peniophora sp. CONT]